MEDQAPDWLAQFNHAAQLANESRNEEALATLNELPPLLEQDGSLTSKFWVEFELRRAELCSRTADHQTSLKRYSTAMRIACDEVGEEQLVCSVVRRLLETIHEWENWQLLLDTGKQVIGLLENYQYRLAQMEAGYHMPFAYRGLGDFESARNYAETIMDALQRAEVSPDEILRWQQFLDSISNR